MKAGLLAIIIGIILAIFGVIFHLQGKGIVGPESSFMYYNPQWIDYGLIILISGIIVVGIGFFLQKRS